MRTVEDDTGKRYLLCKRSDDSSLVRDPETGEERHVRNDRLEPVDERPLETAARAVPPPVRTLLTSVHDEATLGLLLELDERGPLAVRSILATFDFCESDLHGRLAVLTAADLLEETAVAGERGYRPTETCERALDLIRGTNAVDGDVGMSGREGDASDSR